jgi:hypothetical protein
MACNPLQPASCVAAAAASGVDAVAGAAAEGFAHAIQQGATWVVSTTIGWWLDVPTIDLNTSPATRIRTYVLGIAALVAVGGVIWQGILLALSRKPEPVLTVGRGLFTLALWTALGVAGPAAALRAGDAFSSWVLDQAASGRAAQRLVALSSLSQVTAPGAVIVLGVLVMLAGLAQALLMMFREAAVIILAGVVVLAAAGSMTGATKPWLARVLGWMLALICYKPAAALVYASALALVGNSADARTTLVGLAMMLLAIIALPALMRLFTWTTGAVASGGGGLASLAGATAAGLHATAALSYYRSHSPSSHAESISNDLGPSGGSGPADPAGPSRTSGVGGIPPAGGAPSGPSPSVIPTEGATTTSTIRSGSTASATTGAGGAATSTAAGAASPWLLAAQNLTEAARTADDTAQSTAQSMTPEDQP